MPNFNIPTISFKRTFHKVALSTLIAAFVPLSATAHDSHNKPMFGGIVTDAGGLQLELVLKATEIVLHVSDHTKPIDLKGANARITVLNGSEKTEISLTAHGSKFEGKAATANLPTQKGVKAMAVVTFAGKAPMTARFEVK